MNSSGQPTRLSVHLVVALTWAACQQGTPVEEIQLPSLANVEQEVVEAIAVAHAALLREPESGKAWGRLGDHFFVHDFPLQAAQCYSRAEELDPESFLWPYRLGLSWIKDHPELAAAPLERTLRSLDNYAPAHAVYANVLVRLGRSDEAIEHYTRASQLDAGDPQAETGLGLILLARGEFDAARQHLEQALARDERHVEAHVALAQAYLALGMDRKAQRHAELSRALPQPSLEWDAIATPNLPPTGARARTRFGRHLEEQKRPDEAVEQYRAALHSNPDYYLARRSLANLLLELGRRDEAIELLREAERLHPTFEEVRKDLAKILRAEEPTEEAGE